VREDSYIYGRRFALLLDDAFEFVDIGQSPTVSPVSENLHRIIPCKQGRIARTVPMRIILPLGAELPGQLGMIVKGYAIGPVYIKAAGWRSFLGVWVALIIRSGSTAGKRDAN